MSLIIILILTLKNKKQQKELLKWNCHWAVSLTVKREVPLREAHSSVFSI